MVINRKIKVNLKRKGDEPHCQKSEHATALSQRSYSGLFTDSMNFTTSRYRTILWSPWISANNRRDICVAADEGGPFPLEKPRRRRRQRWRETVDGDGNDEGWRWRKVEFENQALLIFPHFRSRKYLLKLMLILIFRTRIYANKNSHSLNMLIY